MKLIMYQIYVFVFLIFKRAVVQRDVKITKHHPFWLLTSTNYMLV